LVKILIFVVVVVHLNFLSSWIYILSTLEYLKIQCFRNWVSFEQQCQKNDGSLSNRLS